MNESAGRNANEMLKTVHLVGLGMGPEHLGPAAVRLVEAADVLAGGSRLLDYFPNHRGEKLPFSGPLSQWLDRIAEAARDARVVVLASGDPNYYGIAERLMQRVGPENIRIHPNVTTIQTAFARLKETWAGVAVVSLHGRGGDALFDALRQSNRVAVYTDKTNTPVRIAEMLLERGQTGWRMAVIENLGSSDSRISYYRLQDALKAEFSDLNLVALWLKETPAPLMLGTPDNDFFHEAGLITKSEVRAVALSRLSLKPGLVLWDLGAGCGSVGLEASLLMPGGAVIAVEKDPERIGHIQKNRAKFGVAALQVVEGELPEAMDGLPDPHRIFIGGGGSALAEIIETGGGRLLPGGVMVAAAVRLDSLDVARRAMTGLGFEVDMTHVQISRSTPLGGDHFFKPLNPVWLVRGEKPI